MGHPFTLSSSQEVTSQGIKGPAIRRHLASNRLSDFQYEQTNSTNAIDVVMIAINYLAILVTLASPLLARAAWEGWREIPLVICLSQEDVDEGVRFITMLNHSPARSKTPTKADLNCAAFAAAQQVELGNVLIGEKKGDRATFQLYPIKGDGDGVAAGVDQRCKVTMRDWPEKQNSTFYGENYRDVFPSQESYRPIKLLEGQSENVFGIECSIIKPWDTDADRPVFSKGLAPTSSATQ